MQIGKAYISMHIHAVVQGRPISVYILMQLYREGLYQYAYSCSCIGKAYISIHIHAFVQVPISVHKFMAVVQGRPVSVCIFMQLYREGLYQYTYSCSCIGKVYISMHIHAVVQGRPVSVCIFMQFYRESLYQYAYSCSYIGQACISMHVHAVVQGRPISVCIFIQLYREVLYQYAYQIISGLQSQQL